MPSIDRNVVQMVFDNKQFEQGVSQSTKSLAELKKGLELDKAVSSLSNIEKAAKGLDLSGIADGVSNIESKFSALGVLGITVMQNLVNKAVDAGIQIAKSLSIDNIGMGEQKYETKTKAVQTIMAATGKSIEEVEGVLSRLMKYTDDTSYDFAGMVSSIGKFTSAGVDLDVAEKAMEGIANEAARSGAGIQEANRAMYNFAQSLAQGSVKLIDWKSIANANMATKEFKEELIKTALEMGTLSKGASSTAGNIIKQTKKATKTTAAEFKNVEVNFQTFDHTLSEGWLTSDVLIKTLSRYGDVSTEIGKASFEAAKSYRTWGDVKDTIKDAVSSGWMRTFEYLFGNLEEAKALWTRVGDSILNFTSIFTDARNELLKGWHELGGYNSAIEAASNIWHTFMDVVLLVKQAFENIFPPTTADNLVKITKKIEDSTKKLKKIFGIYEDEEEVEKKSKKKVSDTAEDLNNIIKRGDRNDYTRVLQKALISKGYLDKGQADGIFGPKTEEAVKKLQKALGVEVTGVWDRATREAAIAQKKFAKFETVTETVTKKNKQRIATTTAYYQKVENAVQRYDIGAKLKKGDHGSYIKGFNTFLHDYGYLSDKAYKSSADKYTKKTEAAVKKLQQELGVKVTGQWDKVTIAAVKANSKFDETVTKAKKIKTVLRGTTKQSDKLQTIFENFFSIIKLGKAILDTGKKALKYFADSFKPLGKPLERILLILSGAFRNLDYQLENNELPTFLSNFKKMLKPLRTFIKNVAESINKFLDGYEKFKKKMAKKMGLGKNQKVLDSFQMIFAYIADTLKKSPIGKFVIGIWEKIQPTVTKILDFLGKVKDTVVNFFTTLFDSIKNASGSSDSIIDKVKSVFGSIVEWFKTTFGNLFGPKDAEGAKKSFDLLGGVGKVIGKVIDFVSKLDIGQLALFGIGIYAAFNIYKKIKAPMDIVSNISKTVKGVGDFVQNANKRKTMDSIASFAKDLSISIALLAASVYAIAQIEPGRAFIAVGVIASLLALIGTFAFLMKKLKLDSVNMKGIIKFAAAILILSNVVKSLAKLKPEKLVQGLIGLGVILGEIIAYTKLMEGNTVQSAGMIGLALGLMGMVMALRGLAKLKPHKMVQGLVGLGVVMLELAVFLRLTDQKEFKTGPLKMIGIAAALLLLTISLKSIAKMQWSELIKGLVGLGALFLELAVFMRLTSGFGSSKGLLGMVGIGIAMLLLAKSMSMIAKLDAKGIVKGIIGLGAIFLELAIFMKLISGNNPLKMLGLAVSLIGIGVALGLVVMSFKALGKMKGKAILKGVVALGAIFLEIAAFMKLIGGRNGLNMMANSAALVGIGVALNLFVLSIAGLAMISVGGLVKGIVALGALFLEIAVFLKLINGSNVSLKALPVLIVIAGSLLVFAIALLAVARVPWSTIISFGITFGVVMGTMSVAMTAMGKLPITGALTAIANLDIFIANLVLILGAFAGLQKLTGGEFGEWMKTGASIIGETIGSFINGIMSGINKSDGQSKKKKSKKLSDYIKEFLKEIESIIPSIEKLGNRGKNINKKGLEKVAAAIGWFAAMAAEMLATELIQVLRNITQFIGSLTGQNYTMEDFVTEVRLLVPSLVKLSKTKADLNADNLKKISEAFGQFAVIGLAILATEFVEVLNNVTNFLNKKITGKNSLVTFTEKVKYLVPSIVKLSKISTKGLNSSNLDSIAKAFEALSKMAIAMLATNLIEVLDNLGDFLNIKITGEKGLNSFIQKVQLIVPELFELSQLSTKDISVKRLTNIASGMEALSAMATASLKVSWKEWLANIPDFLNGNSNVVDFCTKMLEVAPKLKELGDKTGDIKTQPIENTAKALEALAKVANQIPPTDGFIQGIMGEQNIATFGDRLGALGKGVYLFYYYTNGIPDTFKAEGPIAVIKALAEVEHELEAHEGLIQKVTGEKDLGKFGSDLATFGTNFTTFYTNMNGVDVDRIHQLGTGLQALITAVNMVPAQDQVRDQLNHLGFLMQELDPNDPDLDFTNLIKMGEKFVEKIKEGFGNKEGDVIDEADLLAQGMVAVVKAQYKNFKSAGRYLGQGIAKGIESYKQEIINAATGVADAAVNATKGKKGFDEKSPSKKGKEIGKFFDLGIASGLQKYSDKVGKTSADSADNAVLTAQSAFSNLNDVINSDINSEPTIRPVLDATTFRKDVSNEMSSMNVNANVTPMINTEATVKRANSISADVQNEVSVLKDALNRRDAALSSSFKDLAKHLDDLDSAIENMGLYLDGDTLVGGIIGKVDRGLGKRQVMARRMN